MHRTETGCCSRGAGDIYDGTGMSLRERMSLVRKVCEELEMEHWDVENQPVIAARIDEESTRPDIIMAFDEDSINFYSYIEDLDDQEGNIEMFKFINLLNQHIGGGYAALAENYRDVYFRTAIELKDIRILTEEIVKKNLARVIYNLTHYGIGVVAVASGYMDADSAIDGLASGVAE